MGPLLIPSSLMPTELSACFSPLVPPLTPHSVAPTNNEADLARCGQNLTLVEQGSNALDLAWEVSVSGEEAVIVVCGEARCERGPMRATGHGC
jgi:hypothetical protein